MQAAPRRQYSTALLAAAAGLLTSCASLFAQPATDLIDSLPADLDLVLCVRSLPSQRATPQWRVL